jgi:MFS family permease
MLDAFDVMLYALVLAAMMTDLSMDKATAGILGSLTLVASAAGGFAFGVVADRFGRTRALMASVLLYAIFTAACGLAQNVQQLAVFRVLLGLGMGGEWAAGAALVAETWPEQHRGKALGLMQSSWAIGYALAAVITAVVLPLAGWRVVFFVGILPAFFTLWIRRNVEEPAIWLSSRSRARSAHPPAPARIFVPGRRRVTVALTAMNAFAMFAWWGFNLWVPAYLSLPAGGGGAGLGAARMSLLVIAMQAGMWFGYISFGFISDAAGRKRTYVAYLLAAAVLLAVYGSIRSPLLLLFLGPVVAFFGTGHFTGFGAVSAEIFPTAVRATAQGVTYNTGRIVSAAAPYLVGSWADSLGFGAAFTLAAGAFLLAAACWIWIPETRGRRLE